MTWLATLERDPLCEDCGLPETLCECGCPACGSSQRFCECEPDEDEAGPREMVQFSVEEFADLAAKVASLRVTEQKR